MITGSIARRWAKALFAIGEEQGNLVGLVSEVQRAADAWRQSEELQVAMVNPLLAEKTRLAVWDALARRLGMSRMGKNFMGLLFEKNRLVELPAIARELGLLNDKKDNRLRAELSSVVPLDNSMVVQLRSALQRSTGKAVVVSTKQDKSLIGGIVTTVGNVMYDGSLKTQLSRIKEEMQGRR